MPRRPRRSVAETAALAERQARAAELAADGLTVREIGAEMGCSSSTATELVHGGLDAIRLGPVQRYRDVELRRIERMWRANERTRRMLQELVDGGDLDAVGALAKVEATAVKLLERRARLLGTDAPTKLDVRDERPLEKMTVEELQALASSGKAA